MHMRTITRTNLYQLLEKIHATGQNLLAPIKTGTRVDFAPMTSIQDITDDYIQTTRSAKSVFFPPVEELMRYRGEGDEMTIQERDVEQIPITVLFGVRPCDAAAIASLSAVFTQDRPDALFAKRLERTTVIACSCQQADDACFCTSVGSGPGDGRGSDVLMTRLDQETYLAEFQTEKGEAFYNLAPDLFTAATSARKEDHLAEVPQKFDSLILRQKLATAFDHPLWQQVALACLGCGACAYVCPVCSCFDIQDEGSRKKGVRLRCWDACGFGQFTAHTSGHNTRSTQSERWRQRMLHKFSYMPEQLQVLGCVGCGRCTRACPAQMNILEQIEHLLAAL